LFCPLCSGYWSYCASNRVAFSHRALLPSNCLQAASKQPARVRTCYSTAILPAGKRFAVVCSHRSRSGTPSRLHLQTTSRRFGRQRLRPEFSGGSDLASLGGTLVASRSWTRRALMLASCSVIDHSGHVAVPSARLRAHVWHRYVGSFISLRGLFLALPSPRLGRRGQDLTTRF